MRKPPPDLTETALLKALRAGWPPAAGKIEFLPLGAGSYSWSVVGRWFARVDDLGFDPAGRDEAFAELHRSLATAVSLRNDSGLDFVLAPLPDQTGAPLRRLSSRYALSLYPLVDGVAGPFAPHPPADRAEIVDLLARLHDAPPGLAPRITPALPGRSSLEVALGDLGSVWDAGPYAEQARALLAGRADDIHGWLAEFDRLVAELPADGVLTHGEPHPGNVLRTADGLLLIDWDTVAVAPPERDLWMLTGRFATLVGAQPDPGDEEVLARYTARTGRTVSEAGLALYPLWWTLADIAVFTDELRRGEDAPESLAYLGGYLRRRR
ncbi:putative phosphotransferase [Actinoplanes missouriensis 431]|uniref:Putative phosphotransferase n=1 Tax=Actinoplanes missouriensis (strain ATCC 14538 / DSM 43046 / CBS 188.64 / JCM 3121 / NBRC 102363 / NCIMB 12654 / NRRL B-3342 / UNCC 431) TaxID=512565 RepID=I0H765_ACTM4|nr:phosphotransferase [Actinoplanes missouriensis]BAL88852.1 putative phosphotransferase [Actinoplanes missouriensis 431]